MAALQLAKALVATATDLRLLPATLASFVVAITVLRWWGIRCRRVLFGRRPAERALLRTTGSAGAAATEPDSRSPPPHFFVLCVGMGVVLQAGPLVAAAELRLHPATVVCAVIAFTALVNWAILSLNFGVAAVRSSNLAHSAFLAVAALMPPKSPNSRTVLDADCKESHPAATPPPIAEAQPPRAGAIAAPALRPYQSHVARAAFFVLAALISTSWFLEPFVVAAEELRLPWQVVVATLLVFITCFYASVHTFCSFFLPRQLAAGAPQLEGVATIAAVAVGVAACLVAGGASAYEYAPARI